MAKSAIHKNSRSVKAQKTSLLSMLRRFLFGFWQNFSNDLGFLLISNVVLMVVGFIEITIIKTISHKSKKDSITLQILNKIKV